MKYTDLLRQKGAWAGYLELYAVSVAHAVNIVVLQSNAVHKFPAKADASDIGP